MQIGFSFVIFLALVGCQSIPPTTSEFGWKKMSIAKSGAEGASMPFVRQKNYLSMELPFASASELRQQIEEKLGKTLKHRGEAHITVLTPPEYSKIQSIVPIEEINKLAEEMKIQSSKIDIQCLGRGKLGDEETYFVVVRSPELLQLRAKIESLHVERGGDHGLFLAQHFYPHITLGFLKRDLHESDGVIKDRRSCLADLEIK